ncbi:hypothetical protein SAMN00777080_1429 [Aquiflexum balticum DSM 16537]|uniref:DUF3311 domain-containing protein n=1 Tax=Aquiflexum balticum DSM 16537 TaxID=758820 RepID=A0A1W2H2K8_9BACT|nr:hypothetical protein [Aquiflexum balticum]SMD42862.1 hypothetical protein SAMN00777080_1429 [Aquiflexum balticum DSM 16537]
MKDILKSQYLWAVFFLGLFLLNYPVLSIYNIPKAIFGIPLLFIMVFGFWALLILLTYLVVKKMNRKNNA